jgi:RNA polymerase sigma-70 factor (ECF subfamily)
MTHTERRGLTARLLGRTEEVPAATGAEGLVERARRGDQLAFQTLLEVRIGGLLRLAAAILGDDDDARDAVQQASLQAWRELPALREPARFDAWLGRIITNACRSVLRSRRRRRVREIPVGSLDEMSGIALAARSAPGPGERRDEIEVVSRAFDRLSADARILLALHHLEGHTISETASLSGISLATTKWRLHMARAALERALEVEQR